MVPAPADANQTSLAWLEEVTFGVVPTGNYQLVRLTSETLGRDTESVVSDEIDAGRQDVDNIRVGAQAGGDVQCELHADSHDEWFKYGLLTTAWAGAVAAPTTGNIEVIPGASTTVFQRSASTWASQGAYAIGAIVRFSGSAANPSNDGYWKIVAVDSPANDLECVGVGTAEGPTAAATLVIPQLNQIVNGTTLKSICMEREYTNLSNQFAVLTGQTISGFSIETIKKDKVKCSFTFLGKDEAGGTSTVSSGNVAKTITKTYAVTAHLDTFVFNGDRTPKMTEFRLTATNGLYTIDDAGELTPTNIGTGTFAVEGDWQFYYRDKLAFDQYESFGDVDFMLALEDSSGNGMVIDLPRTNLISGRRNMEGKSQAVLGKIGYRAAKDAAEAITMRMART